MIELVSDHFSERTSHLPLRTLHQAIESAPNCLDPLRHHPWPGGMREAIRRPPGGVLDGGTSKNQSKIFPNLPVLFSPDPSQGPSPGPNIPPGRPELTAPEPF